MRFLQLLLALGLLLAAGCTTVTPPDSGNGSVFVKNGCIEVYKDCTYLHCSAIGLEESFSCDRIVLTNITGMVPNTEIAECWKRMDNFDENVGIRRGGCMARQSVIYIAAVHVMTNFVPQTEGWDLEKLSTWADFKSLFGPVGSKEAALAFARAFSGDSVYSGEIPLGARRFVAMAEPTSVKESTDGYTVNLLRYQFCGCGPHPYYVNTYFVNKTGEVAQVSSQKIYENPEQDGLCVD
ncbi:Uncharacterised protein [uncultured archaeon]|nr:Uncharacterised protein [uncultured archaeon]